MLRPITVLLASQTLQSLAAFSIQQRFYCPDGSILSCPLGRRIPHSRKPLRAGTKAGLSARAESSDGKTLPGLRYLGDERLMQRQPNVSLEELSSAAFNERLLELNEAMKHYGGIGIAAPQVGWWTRVFCFGIQETNPRYPAAAAIPLQFWINPEIVWSSKETNWMWEGCLSVPGMRGWVERPKEVAMKGRNEKGEECLVKLGGLPARVAQHELDHLDGILFPSRVPAKEFLVPQASIETKEGWAEGWPSAGSHKTGLGELQDEK